MVRAGDWPRGWSRGDQAQWTEPKSGDELPRPGRELESRPRKQDPRVRAMHWSQILSPGRKPGVTARISTRAEAGARSGSQEPSHSHSISWSRGRGQSKERAVWLWQGQDQKHSCKHGTLLSSPIPIAVAGFKIIAAGVFSQSGVQVH